MIRPCSKLKDAMPHESPRVDLTARASATTKTAERESAKIEAVESFFTALVKHKDTKAVACYPAHDLMLCAGTCCQRADSSVPILNLAGRRACRHPC
jgi:hypothetical protein